ncbi:MAG: TolC family protein [Candidatus Eremiobacteraeota bacterium]|nr:TolC family protein [Candidatus Eremiobacteraeota bacterium]
MRFMFLFILLTFSELSIASGEGLAPETLELTLNQALEIADRGNPDLQVSNQSISVAQTGITIAGQRPNPSLTYAFPIGPAERKQRLVFNVPIETGGRRQARLTVAEAKVREAELGLVRDRQLVLNQTRNAFVELAIAKAALSQAQRDLQFMDRLVEVAERRFEAGDVAEADVFRAIFEREQIQRTLYPAENRVEVATINLNRLLGYSLETTIKVIDSSHLFPTEETIGGETWQVPELQTLQEMAQERRPDLALATQQIETAQHGRKLARANQSPDLALQAGLLYDPFFPAFTYQIGVQLELPWGSDRGGEVQQAQAQEEQARFRREALLATAKQSVTLAYTNFQTARRQLHQDLGVLEPQAERVLSLAEKIYELGQGDITELLVAGQSVQRQRQLYLADVARLHQSLGELELAVNSRLIGENP